MSKINLTKVTLLIKNIYNLIYINYIYLKKLIINIVIQELD